MIRRVPQGEPTFRKGGGAQGRGKNVGVPGAGVGEVRFEAGVQGGGVGTVGSEGVEEPLPPGRVLSQREQALGALNALIQVLGPEKGSEVKGLVEGSSSSVVSLPSQVSGHLGCSALLLHAGPSRSPTLRRAVASSSHCQPVGPKELQVRSRPIADPPEVNSSQKRAHPNPTKNDPLDVDRVFYVFPEHLVLEIPCVCGTKVWRVPREAFVEQICMRFSDGRASAAPNFVCVQKFFAEDSACSPEGVCNVAEHCACSCVERCRDDTQAGNCKVSGNGDCPCLTISFSGWVR